ncbi:MAG: hypothetical protein JNG86_07605 [Verrucomicrobiaceae bacterium]|nr:hypothetical protein [Verrucomicrobiaceae bacterium]
MKSFAPALFAALLTTVTASAEPHWRFSAGYAPMIGIKAEFKGFGNFQNLFPVPPPAAGTNYFYTDGFVQLDSSGNFGGLTTFWLYNNATQFDPTGFGGMGAINYTTLVGSGLNQTGSVTDDNIAASAGFDLRADLHFGAVSFLPKIAGRPIAWGLHSGFQYSRVDVSNSDSLTASLTTINDSFNLNGLAPLAPGIPGSFTGPNVMIGDTPTRTFGAANASITGSRDLDVQVFITQIGSYLEIPITKKIDLMLEGGFLVGVASGSYDYTTTVAVPGVGAQTTSGHSSHNRLLPGFYTGLGLTYNITPHFGIQGAARYQYMRQFDLIANGSDASLSFDSAFVLSLSAVWKF